MSMVDFAIEEMQRANFDEGDIAFIIGFLREFYERYDSGGAVWAMSDVLQRLIKGQPLSPLTGEDDEWVDVAEYNGQNALWQNRRCPTVFKDAERAYDIDVAGRPTVTFPYDPTTKLLEPPVVTFDLTT